MLKRASLQFFLMGLLLGLVPLSGCDVRDNRATLELGDQLPTLQLVDRAGNPVSSERWRGRVLVLNLWATWCGPCRKEMPSLQRLSEQLDRQRFQVVGLTVDDDPLLVEEFLLRYGIDFSVVRATDRMTLEQQLGVTAYPDTLLVSPEGKLLQRVSGERDWDADEWVAKVRAADR